MKKLIILSSLFLLGCTHQPGSEKNLHSYSSRVFQLELDQFGYDIMKDSLVVIHQPIIPGASGNKGFALRQDAQKVADLMIYKLEQGIDPPSISAKELDSLKIKQN